MDKQSAFTHPRISLPEGREPIPLELGPEAQDLIRAIRRSIALIRAGIDPSDLESGRVEPVEIVAESNQFRTSP